MCIGLLTGRGWRKESELVDCLAILLLTDVGKDYGCELVCVFLLYVG